MRDAHPAPSNLETYVNRDQEPQGVTDPCCDPHGTNRVMFKAANVAPFDMGARALVIHESVQASLRRNIECHDTITTPLPIVPHIGVKAWGTATRSADRSTMKFSKVDQFESTYMAKFRALVAAHGVVIQTEKDRAAFDVGMIPTQDIGSTTTSLVNPTHVWFQLKGVVKATVSADEIAKAESIKVVVKREHLHFWHYYDAPIYLVAYAEATDKFYIINMKRWIKEQGIQSILHLKTVTKTISVPTDHPASPAVFDMIRRDAHSRTVASAIGGETKDAKTFLRDDAVIWRLSTLKKRKRDMRVRLIKYGSKMRSEVHFEEKRLTKNERELVRLHWQYAMGDLNEVFPYLNFKPVGPLFKVRREVDEEGHEHTSLERVDDEAFFWEEDEQCFEDGELLELHDGRFLQGSGSFEMFQFEFVPSLNAVGRQWATALQTLINCGVLTVSTEPVWISVAPWNKAL